MSPRLFTSAKIFAASQEFQCLSISFNLDARLLKNVQAMDFEEPTPIQSATIPAALEGRDILGSAETGTGKTAAFLLPLLQKLINTPRTREPRALVLLRRANWRCKSPSTRSS